MTAAAVTLAVVAVGLLVVGYALLPHHAVAGNRLGRVAGERVHVGADLPPRPGDLLICQVCRCGAYRPLGARLWSSILCRNNH